MKDRDEWLEALPQLLAGEDHVYTTLSRNVGRITNDPKLQNAFVLTLVQMIRCYGQMDGVLSLIKADGDIQSTVTDIAAEISRLRKKMDSIRDRI